MSGLDQPLLVANANYHVGHQIPIRVAEEQGFFRDEGLTNYEFESRGLIPFRFERDGLALAMREHGVDLATAVNVGSALHQRARGEDVYIVGGWRSSPDLKYFGSHGMTELRDLRGGRVGVREIGSLEHLLIADALRQVGVDPEREITWVCDEVFAYRNNPRHLEWLRSGKVAGMPSSPPFSRQLEQEGYPVLFDPNAAFPGGRPDKVTVATRRTVEERGDDLRAYFRAIIRAFWFMRDAASFEYLRDLELRLRETSHNDEERRIRIVTSVEKVEGWALPIHAGISRPALERIVEELRARGELDRPFSVDDVLRDEAVTDAYREVGSRPELQPAHQRMTALVERYGF